MSFAELRSQAEPGTLELQLYRGRPSIAETSVKLSASSYARAGKCRQNREGKSARVNC